MDTIVGQISYIARIDTSKLPSDAAQVENTVDKTGESVVSSGRKSFSTFSRDASGAFESISSGLSKILKGALLIGTSGAFGIGAATKASWDQASAVQQATVALGAYEKNTGKVNNTLSSLVAYARSDLGVLFNRKDLFESAQGLKIMGDNTDQLSEHVQILSRSVGLGLSNWSDLNQIVGRIGSTGRLTGEDFDNLTKAGFKLDTGLRNTNITFDELFKQLDKGIPADAMAGQANTIVGLGVRMQTAFRGIGDAILGVDKDTGKFVEGGLGSKLVGLMGTLTNMLKNPALKEGFAKMGQTIGDFAQKALPILIQGFTWVVNNLPTVVDGVLALVAAFAAAKVAAIGFAIAASPFSAVIIGIAALIVGLVAALTFLQLRFDIFGKAADGIVSGWQAVGEFFRNLWSDIQSIFGNIGQWFSEKFTEAKNSVTKTFNSIKDTAKEVLDAIEGWIDDNSKEIRNVSIVITTVLLPKIVLIGTTFLVSAGQATGSFIMITASAILNALLTSTAWILSAVRTSFAWTVQTLPAIIAGFATMAFQATINALKISAAFILASSRTLISWGITFAGYILGMAGIVAATAIGAAQMVISWALALGPIGLIGAAVIGLTALIIANFDTVKGWVAGFWDWLKDTAASAWNGVKNVFSGVGNFFRGVWDTIKNIFTTIGSAIGNAIGGAFKGVVNSVINFAENSINGFIKAINGAIGAINKIPGVDIKKINEFNIPRLAKGGIISSPTLAMIGEGRESEAVIPLSQLDKMMNEGGSNNSKSTNITINLSGIMARSTSDLREIGKDIIKAVNQEIVAQGKPAIGGIR